MRIDWQVKSYQFLLLHYYSIAARISLYTVLPLYNFVFRCDVCVFWFVCVILSELWSVLWNQLPLTFNHWTVSIEPLIKPNAVKYFLYYIDTVKRSIQYGISSISCGFIVYTVFSNQVLANNLSHYKRPTRQVSESNHC